jgi:hypothetical protein
MVKKQLFRSGIALLAVILALGISGCGSDTDDAEKNDNTTLVSIKIGSGEAQPFYGDHSAESVAAITTYVTVKLSNSDKNEAAVTLTPGGNFKGKMEIAKVGKGGGASASFAAYAAGSTKITFAPDDEVYIKMIAEDGAAIRYYGVKVEIGTDAGLKSIIVGNDAVEEFGTPADTLAEVTTPGAIMMTQYQPDAGFAITVTPNDADAAVSFGKGEAVSDWTAGKQQTIKFEDEEFIGVKVVSGNGQVTKYYKITVELMPVMAIPYGTPSLGTGDFVDPLWNAIPWIPVKKQNRAETDEEFYADPSTSGQAKLYWDADGLWLYVDVTGPVSTNTAFEHNGSSVELFINEAYPEVESGNYNDIGGQYRLGSDGVTSGDPGAAVNAMSNLGKHKAVIKTDGYFVIFQAPWRFAATYNLADNKKISLEIQINAARKSGTGRVGVLKWYNTTANTYQNASALAEGILKLNGNTLPTQKPVINTQPTGQRVPLNGTVSPLTVEAVSADGGTLSYQWYRSATATNTGGTIINGATSASYTPTTVSTAAPGEFFFYVEVTNTKGGSPATAASNVARILVYDPAVTASDIELVNLSHANWDATENALVINFTGGQYNTFVAVPIPSTVDLSSHVRMDVKWNGYLADDSPALPTSGIYDNDIIAEVFDGMSSSLGQFGYNISAFDGDTYSYNLSESMKEADFSGGQGKVNLNAKWGTNTDGIAKYVIKSVKFIVED